MNDNHRQAFCPSLCTVAGHDLMSTNDNPMPSAKMRKLRIAQGWKTFDNFLAELWREVPEPRK